MRQAAIRSPVLLSKLPVQACLLRLGDGTGRRLKGLIELGPQIPMGEQVHPEQGHQIGERPSEPGLQLQVPQDQHGNHGRPDLDLDGVGTGAHKHLDLQVLFERLEEQFDMPAILVDVGDGGGAGWSSTTA